MKIGEKLFLTPTLATSYGEHAGGPQEAVVIWIHPQLRYFRARYTELGFVEAFPCPDRPNIASRAPGHKGSTAFRKWK